MEGYHFLIFWANGILRAINSSFGEKVNTFISLISKPLEFEGFSAVKTYYLEVVN